MIVKKCAPKAFRFRGAAYLFIFLINELKRYKRGVKDE